MSAVIDDVRWRSAVAEALSDDQVLSALSSGDVEESELRDAAQAQRDDIAHAISIHDPLSVEQRSASQEQQLAREQEQIKADIADWSYKTDNRAAVAVVVAEHAKLPASALEGDDDTREAAKLGLVAMSEAIAHMKHVSRDGAFVAPSDTKVSEVLAFLAGFVLFLTMLTFLITCIVYVFYYGWGHVSDHIVAAGSFALRTAEAFGGSLIALVAFLVIASITKDTPFSIAKKTAKPTVLQFAREIGLRIAKVQQDLDLLRRTRAEAEQQTVSKLTAEVAARMRVFVAQKKEPNYSDELPNVEVTTELAEILNPNNIVGTEAGGDVKRLIESMTGGSIGIAGPRGAGKSTLIGQMTRLSQIQRTTRKQATTKSVLGVMTSAPVRYDGREFILHLFSAVCDRLLIEEPRQGNAEPWERAFITERRSVPTRYDDALLNLLPNALRILGFVTIFLFLLAIGALFTPKPAPAGLPPVVVRIEGLRTTTVMDNPPPLAKNAAVGSMGQAFASFIRDLGLQPLSIAGTALQCFVVFLLLRRVALSLTQSAYESTTESWHSPRKKGINPPGGSSSDDSAWKSVIAAAAEWDIELRYQQTFSSGWSGALKLPGVEAAANNSASLVTRQLTFPELATAFRDFLSLLTPWFVVVIGVDELDKISSAETAHEFLNEVKAVFGVPGIFYLVSVSDSALSSFARRGLPVRDAFDSAFDEIVRIEYMTHEQARLLLARRVIGLPEPITSFCHCLSGGLPRDLIRACRGLFVTSQETGSRKLGKIAKRMLIDDVNAKADASITYVLDHAAGSLALPAIVAIRDLATAVRLEGDLQPTCQVLLNLASSLAAEAVRNNDPTSRVLADIVADLATYTFYAATLHNTFASYPSEKAWRTASDENVFCEIAEFRQNIARNSQSSIAGISAFRVRHSMSLFTLA